MTKTRLFLAILFLLFAASLLCASEIIKFQLFDGETAEGKLSLPADTTNIKEL